jgi:hypothetical protein
MESGKWKMENGKWKMENDLKELNLCTCEKVLKPEAVQKPVVPARLQRNVFD